MVNFGEFLKTWSLRSNSVTRQVSFKIGQKLVENANIQKFKCDILGDFQTLWIENYEERSNAILPITILQNYHLLC